jgi:hypothetical protein
MANIELEQALLGATLADAYHLNRIKTLRPEHFFDAGQIPTPLILKHRFDADPALHDFGGGAYLGKLMASSIAVLDARDCEQQIISLWRGRKLGKAWQDGIAMLFTCTAEEAAAIALTARNAATNPSSTYPSSPPATSPLANRPPKYFHWSAANSARNTARLSNTPATRYAPPRLVITTRPTVRLSPPCRMPSIPQSERFVTAKLRRRQHFRLRCRLSRDNLISSTGITVSRFSP